MSRTFKDATGREWLVSITVGVADRLVGVLGVDLLDLKNFHETVGRLSTDRRAFTKTIYLVSRQVAEGPPVPEEAFWDGMDGDALESALDAFVGGLIEFFPKVEREALTAAWAKMNEVHARVMTKARTGLESAELEAKITEIIETAGKSSTSAPESSA